MTELNSPLHSNVLSMDEVVQKIVVILGTFLKAKDAEGWVTVSDKIKKVLESSKLQVIPPGWKMVPMTPDVEMMNSAAEAFEGVQLCLNVAAAHGVTVHMNQGLPPIFHAWIKMVLNAPGSPEEQKGRTPFVPPGMQQMQIPKVNG